MFKVGEYTEDDKKVILYYMMILAGVGILLGVFIDTAICLFKMDEKDANGQDKAKDDEQV